MVDKKREKIFLEKDRWLQVNRLTMEDKEGVVQSWYWFVAGKRFIPSYYLQQIWLAWDAFRNKDLKGALVRISIRGNSEVLEKKAKSFIRLISREVEKIL